MPTLTPRLPRISAHHLLSYGQSRRRIVTILILPAAKSCLQLPLGAQICAPVVAVIAAATMKSVSEALQCGRKCERQTNSVTVHSRFADPEL
jgi:hypothetical protein